MTDPQDPESERDETTSDTDESPPSERPAKKPRRPKARAPVAPPKVLTPLVLVGFLGMLAVGAAGGWFGHEAQAKAHLRADSVAQPAGSGSPAGPCGAWQQKICSSSGAESASCAEAKAAVDLLTPSTCEVALAAMPATLAKIKAERVPCDTLVSKLCAELTEASATCKMVREKTAQFPRNRCSEMLEHFPEVLAELRQLEQQQGMMGGLPGGPGGPGSPAPGGPGVPAPH